MQPSLFVSKLFAVVGVAQAACLHLEYFIARTNNI
jgi:hypothetical protein